jgi:hypothetical protein
VAGEGGKVKRQSVREERPRRLNGKPTERIVGSAMLRRYN